MPLDNLVHQGDLVDLMALVGQGEQMVLLCQVDLVVLKGLEVLVDPGGPGGPTVPEGPGNPGRPGGPGGPAGPGGPGDLVDLADLTDLVDLADLVVLLDQEGYQANPAFLEVTTI